MTERTPLLWDNPSSNTTVPKSRKSVEPNPNDLHTQFCMLVGVPSTSEGDKSTHPKSPPPKSLYGRATRQLSAQRFTYYVTASLSNTLLLTQVVLGAALTALGASESSHILITLFGAMNTIIAGVVAYLKSRGQPMRARMYRDDLERVVDEIENSEIMWLGISKAVHGYDEIDTDEYRVTVRSEVARLTRLYDRAVRNNTLNNPDMYMAGAGYDSSNAALRSRPQQQSGPVPIVAGPPPAATAPVADAPSVPAAVGAVPVAAPHDPDESPASAPPKPKKEEEGKKEESKDASAPTDSSPADEGTASEGKEKAPEADAARNLASPTPPASDSEASSSKPAPAVPAQPTAAFDPDASPATAPVLPKKKPEAST